MQKFYFIVWIKQNEEGELLKSLIPGAIEVKGSDRQEGNYILIKP